MVNPPVSQNTLLIPALGTPVIDPKTGKMAREWYRYFTLIGTAIGPDPTPIPDQPVVFNPPPPDSSTQGPDSDLLGTTGFAAQAIGMIQNLQQQISDLQQSSLPPSMTAGLANMLANAHIFVGNGSGIAADVPVSGDLTLANTGAFTIVTISGQPLGTFATQLIGKGTATNDNAAAGYIGEYIPATASAVALVTATPKTLTSVALTAGDWDLSGWAEIFGAAGTSQTLAEISISTVNNTIQTGNGQFTFDQGVTKVTPDNTYTVPRWRVSLAVGVTIYLVARADFTVSTMQANAFLTARRVR